eukprot:scaffold50140_cov75-Phaeocystis_antarctica.AAC.2
MNILVDGGSALNFVRVHGLGVSSVQSVLYVLSCKRSTALKYTEYSQRVRDRVSRKGRKTMTEGATVLYDCYFIRFTVLYWAAMGTQRQTDSTDNLVQERHTASGMREECDLEMWIERIL